MVVGGVILPGRFGTYSRGLFWVIGIGPYPRYNKLYRCECLLFDEEITFGWGSPLSKKSYGDELDE